MKVNEILSNGKITLSFEVFPPKTDAQFESVRQATIDVAALKPSYMSVTYGAGGNTRKNTVAIAKGIQDTTGVTTIAHLTCVGATKENIYNTLDEMKAAGIENVLALRGDRPRDFEGDPFVDFHYASELVSEIKAYGNFCVGGACYPEGHVEAANKSEDIINLKKKVDAGAELLLSQLFFDNDTFFNFAEDCRLAGINVPVIPGIMPCINAAQIQRMVTMCGAKFPEKFQKIVHRYGDNKAALFDAGMSYCESQIIELLANDVEGIHLYTMNNVRVAKRLTEGIKNLI